MEEITLKLHHDLPFNNVSKMFPEATIYRWCNSYVDYIEIHSDDAEMDRIIEALPAFIEEIHSETVYISRQKGRASVIIKCRCNINNSTIRMTESESCLWRAPVKYKSGEEEITVISPVQENFRSLYDKLSKIGEVEISRKFQVLPEDLRDNWTVSIMELFSEMTDIQTKYILEAISAGYFDTPRRVSLEELAKRNGISQSTMQEHINKARNRIIYSVEPYLRMYLEYIGAMKN
ncbi:MAG: helix-turn-helix domain-containing protein [Candidatus Thermoplasmatota archaeon]|jgi:predicted DNA binding protein|nr:helix-turn-helix domain-containing protein [Candidatus Thermoplasmatota archaeon]